MDTVDIIVGLALVAVIIAWLASLSAKSDLKAKLAAAEQQINTLTTSSTDLQRNLEVASGELAKIWAALGDLQADQGTQTQQSAQLRRELDTADRNLQQASTELERFQTWLQELQAAHQRTTQDLTKCREDHRAEQSRANALEAQLDELRPELRAAVLHIAALQRQKTELFDDHRRREESHLIRATEVDFWHYFAEKVLHDTKSRLDEALFLLKDIQDQGNISNCTEPLAHCQFVRSVLQLASARHMKYFIREMKESASATPINVLPRLRKLVARWSETLKSRLTATLPGPDQQFFFIGTWEHIELLLDNAMKNARTHSPDETPLTFECLIEEHQVTFIFHNESSTGVDDAIRLGTDLMRAGEPSRNRFGLYLMDQIAGGYCGSVDIDNVSTEGTVPKSVRTIIKLPTY